MTEPSAAQLAAFDQAYAQLKEGVHALVATLKLIRADGDGPPEVDIAGLSYYVQTQCDLPAVADLLAVAIDLLAKDGPK